MAIETVTNSTFIHKFYLSCKFKYKSGSWISKISTKILKIVLYSRWKPISNRLAKVLVTLQISTIMKKNRYASHPRKNAQKNLRIFRPTWSRKFIIFRTKTSVVVQTNLIWAQEDRMNVHCLPLPFPPRPILPRLLNPPTTILYYSTPAFCPFQCLNVELMP